MRDNLRQPRRMQTDTVLAALTAAVLDAAVALGFERTTLVTAAGLADGMLDDPDARVPIDRHLRLWQAIAMRPVGLALGARIGCGGLGVVGYALPLGADVGAALALLDRWRALVHPGAVPRVERRSFDGRDAIVFAQSVPAAFARLGEPLDAQAAAVVATMRALAGDDVAPFAVATPRGRPADPSAHEALFRCAIRWGAPALELAFDGDIAARRLPRADERLFGYLSRRTEALAAALPASAAIEDVVRREIGLHLARGAPSIDDIAAMLGQSGRSLQRRLKAVGTSFSDLLETAQHERALVLLADPELSASDVAVLLGFAEPSAFFRAFRRWTGTTPGTWRLTMKQ